MDNIKLTLRKFLGNKNIVTAIGAVLVLVLLYYGYTAQINSQVEPVRVPVANETIQPRTKITSDMITYVEMPKIGITSNVITSTSKLIGYYSAINTVIPAGSMFYTDTIIEASAMPDEVYVQVKEGDIPYNFTVTTLSTYGNSMLPGTYVDLYMKAEDDNGLIMVGKFIENIEILAVRDSSGKDVFENSDENRTPALMIFGVSSEINILLRKAEYMTGYSIEIFPVPHGGTTTETGDTVVSSTYLQSFINSKTVNLPEEVKTTTE